MASYGRNFIIVILIVFYSVMNLNNVNCTPPTDEEKDICRENMKKYCGDDNLLSDLNCAKSAFRNIHEGKSYDERKTPGYVLLYFADHVSPFIPGILSIVDFCKIEELLEYEDVKKLYNDIFHRIEMECSSLGLFAQIKESKTAVIAACKSTLEVVTNGLSIQNFFIKENINNFIGVLFSETYLRVASERLTMLEAVAGSVRKTPEDFCQEYEHH